MATRATKPGRNGKTAATVATGSDGADHDATTGRFVRGNRAACGNAFGRQVAERRRAIVAAVSAEDVGRVARKLYDLSLGGDVAAAKVLLTFVVGRPQPAPNPDLVDLEELAIVRQFPPVEGVVSAGQVDPPLAVSRLLRSLITTPERLLAVLEERMYEAYEEAWRRATVDQLGDIQQLAEAAGIDLGDEDADDSRGGDDDDD